MHTNVDGLVYNYRKSTFGRKWVFYTVRFRISSSI